MPYTNNYPTDMPGIGEARLDALQALIIASLPDLNAALARDGKSPLSFAPEQVIQGDPETVTGSLICLVGGGKQDGTDLEVEGRFIPRGDCSGYQETVSTNIYVYIGPNDMRTDDLLAYVQYRETTRQRVVDHLRKRVFNCAAGASIVLSSREHTTSPDFDTLHDGMAHAVYMGLVSKGSAGSFNVWCAHLVHEGRLA
jgi:hypothetical protein